MDSEKNMQIRSAGGKFPLCDLPADYSFNGVDVVKCICAFLVCIIHIKPFAGDWTGAAPLNFALQNCLCRIAVPFFFVASGFLLFRKTDFCPEGTDRVKNYCLKTLRLLGTWTFLLFVGNRDHLWYLGALVFATALIGVMMRCGVKLRTMLIIAAVLYVIGLFGDAYAGFAAPLQRYMLFNALRKSYVILFRKTRNGLFFGLLYVLIGAAFAQKRIVMRSRTACAGFVVSMLLLGAEAYCLQRFSTPADYNMYVFLAPAVFFLFYLASHVQLRDHPVYKRMRVVGMLVFYLHLFVAFFVNLLFGTVENHWGLHLSAIHFAAILIPVTLLAVALERLSRTEKFSFLRYLYS